MLAADVVRAADLIEFELDLLSDGPGFLYEDIDGGLSSEPSSVTSEMSNDLRYLLGVVGATAVGTGLTVLLGLKGRDPTPEEIANSNKALADAEARKQARIQAKRDADEARQRREAAQAAVRKQREANRAAREAKRPK